MDAWLTDLASGLGLDPLSESEEQELLGIARDVAHSVERKSTPVAAYLLGRSVQQRVAAGTAVEEAFAAALADLRGALPPTV